MLVQWITRFTIIGFFVSPKLILEMAEKIHREYMFFVFQIKFTSLKFHLIGYN